jgi:hypothetical protein
MSHENNRQRSGNKEGQGVFSIHENTSPPEITGSPTVPALPDRSHSDSFGEIDVAKDCRAADRFPSGIIRSGCCPLAEGRVWSMKSLFLTGNNLLRRILRTKSSTLSVGVSKCNRKHRRMGHGQEVRQRESPVRGELLLPSEPSSVQSGCGRAIVRRNARREMWARVRSETAVWLFVWRNFEHAGLCQNRRTWLSKLAASQLARIESAQEWERED